MQNLTEKYFEKIGFKKINDENNVYFLSYDDYHAYGAFEANLVVRELSDGHTWRLSINEYGIDEYQSVDDIDLIEFCNKHIFETFTGMLLIEFKESSSIDV